MKSETHEEVFNKPMTPEMYDDEIRKLDKSIADLENFPSRDTSLRLHIRYCYTMRRSLKRQRELLLEKSERVNDNEV